MIRNLLPVPLDLAPMEAKSAATLPDQEGWWFEPKWDGFRCLVFRHGDQIHLQSKSGKPLARYFPEVVASIQQVARENFVVDGELIIPIDGVLAFDALQMRLHPAESRIRKLAEATPAQLMLFDCLLSGDGRSLTEAPLIERREALENFHREAGSPALRLSPYTMDKAVAQAWLDGAGGDLDGVVAKRKDGPYQSGERAMLKVKRMRTADCVVGGFRYGASGGEVGSLLLGLYDDRGKLNHVGFTSAIPARERASLTARLRKLVEEPGFTGSAPGGPSRWSTEKSSDWQPLRPELVLEVRYDHVTGDRFRHGTKFLRWRPDKLPKQCRMDQLESETLASARGDIVQG